MAIPGSPLDPRYAGTNRILRDGAILVRHAEDVIEVLSRSTPHAIRAPASPHFDKTNDEEQQIPSEQIARVQSVLSPTPMLIEDVARAAKIGEHRCATILVELELAGLAHTYSGGLASAAFE